VGGPFCYGPIEPTQLAAPGTRLQITSRTTPLTATAGWRMKVNDRESPSLEDWAPFQVPYETGFATAIFTHPSLPGFELRLKLDIKDRAYLRCFSTVHGDLLREVSGADPALVGERIRVFMSGIEGEQPVAYGQPNPEALIRVVNGPTLSDPGAATVLDFRLTPGLVGVQQMDLRILRPFVDDAYDLFEFGLGCPVPPIR